MLLFLLFQILIPTKPETLEYFTDSEDPISFGAIHSRYHAIINTVIDIWISRYHGIFFHVLYVIL